MVIWEWIFVFKESLTCRVNVSAIPWRYLNFSILWVVGRNPLLSRRMEQFVSHQVPWFTFKKKRLCVWALYTFLFGTTWPSQVHVFQRVLTTIKCGVQNTKKIVPILFTPQNASSSLKAVKSFNCFHNKYLFSFWWCFL